MPSEKNILPDEARSRCYVHLKGIFGAFQPEALEKFLPIQTNQGTEICIEKMVKSKSNAQYNSMATSGGRVDIMVVTSLLRGADDRMVATGGKNAFQCLHFFFVLAMLF